MKKVLSTVVTLTLVFAMVLSSTVTVEAKSSKSKEAKAQTSKTQTKTLTSGNALLDEFIAVCIASSGMTIDGKSYTAKEVGALNMANNASLISIPGYEADASWDKFSIDGEEDLPAGFVKYNPTDLYKVGLYWQSNDGSSMGSCIRRNETLYTDKLVNRGINSSNLARWMQARGLTSAKSLIDYFALNGVPLPDYSDHVQREQQMMAESANSDGYSTNFYWDVVYAGDYMISIDEVCRMEKIYGKEKNYANEFQITISHYDEKNTSNNISFGIHDAAQNDATNRYMYEDTVFSIDIY